MNRQGTASEHPPGPTAQQLRDEHMHLEEWFIDLSGRAATGEPRECDAVWDDFSRQLEAHLAFEEQHVFPQYERLGPAEAAMVAVLREDHAMIRRQVEALGLDLQLHCARAEVIEAFLAALRSHSRRERDSIYPWLANREAPGATAA